MLDQSTSQQSSLPKKLIVRFLFLYLILYIYPYGFEYIYALDTNDISFWEGITIWFGETVLDWEFSENLWKGFDSKYDFSRFLLIAVLSIIGSIVWIIVDRFLNKSYEDKLIALATTITRYHVAFTLILYGMVKVFPLQFGEVSVSMLTSTFGEQTPMRLLWKFMSASPVYTATTGWVEVTGGLLLLFRRTTFLGATICFVAMTNVVLIDIGYDVTVKMFAIHLFLMVLILLVPHLKRIVSFFLLQQPDAPVQFRPLFSGEKWVTLTGRIAKGILLVLFVITTWEEISGRIDMQMDTSTHFIRGYYEVEEFNIIGDSTASSVDDARNWKALSISELSYRPNLLRIITMDDESKFYQFEADSVEGRLKIQDIYGDSSEFDMRYEELENGKMKFSGIQLGDTLEVTTGVKKVGDFELTSSGIKWIRDL